MELNPALQVSIETFIGFVFINGINLYTNRIEFQTQREKRNKDVEQRNQMLELADYKEDYPFGLNSDNDDLQQSISLLNTESEIQTLNYRAQKLFGLTLECSF